MQRLLFLSVCVTLLFLIAACSEKKEVKVIDVEKKSVVDTKEFPKGSVLKVAIGGMITPKEGFTYYRDFIGFIEKQLGKQIHVIDKDNYAEINNLLETGAIDFAFVCSGPYIDGHDKFGLQLLVAPEVNGRTTYNSLIISNINNKFKNFRDLRGKSFAFTDPLSNTGTLVPTYMLAKIGETPKSFFKELIYAKKHDKSIKMVAENLIDGAAVDSLIWEYMNRKSPDITSKTQIIEKSPAYGIPPVVTSKSLNEESRQKLLEIFLNAHLDPEGKVILKGMMIDKFVTVQDSDYNSVREMLTWTKKHQVK